jgi:hypothetical protein
MTAPSQARRLVITVLRPIPCQRPGWAKDKHCRILAGWYADTTGEPVQVPEQIGEIEGWQYLEWEGKTPLSVRLYVRVTL